MRARSMAATVAPMNVALPPASDAPPRTAAVMLFSAYVEPTCALPIGDRVMTKNEADRREHRRQEERPDPDPVRPDPAALRRPLVEPHRAHSSPEPEAWSHRSRARRDDDDDERHGDRPDPRGEDDMKSGPMAPWASGRRVSEIPFRMLSVASVAMIEGILSPGSARR